LIEVSSRLQLTLSVQFAVPPRGLPVRATLRRWVEAALERDAALTLRFVGRAEGRRLNAQFRGKDYATNVLTFVYDDPSHDALRDAPGLAPAAGDIVICVPVARREARDAGRPLRAHLAHLVVHGVLHLQGYDHVHDGDAARMERNEAEILRRFRYPDPYAPERTMIGTHR
jgi:probable rRNA maturation factor